MQILIGAQGELELGPHDLVADLACAEAEVVRDREAEQDGVAVGPDEAVDEGVGRPGEDAGSLETAPMAGVVKLSTIWLKSTNSLSRRTRVGQPAKWAATVPASATAIQTCRPAGLPWKAQSQDAASRGTNWGFPSEKTRLKLVRIPSRSAGVASRMV